MPRVCLATPIQAGPFDKEIMVCFAGSESELCRLLPRDPSCDKRRLEVEVSLARADASRVAMVACIKEDLKNF